MPTSTAIRSAAVVAGVASVVYLIASTGIDNLVTAIATLSWRIAVVVTFPAAVTIALETLAWGFAFVRMPAFHRLFCVRLAGEAVNVTMASVGGEAVKVYLLRPTVSAVDASAATLVAKTAITLAQVLFLAVGLVVALLYLDVPRILLVAAGVGLILEIGAVTAIVLIQQGRVLGRLVRLLQRWRMSASAERLQSIATLDNVLADFYRQRRGRFALCVAVNLLAWVGGGLEVYLVLRWLGFPVSLPAAVFIDAVGSAISFVAFLVPGRLGVLEGGYVAVFAALGLSGTAGLSQALVRRVRLLVWSVLGVVILTLYRRTPTAASVERVPARVASVARPDY